MRARPRSMGTKSLSAAAGFLAIPSNAVDTAADCARVPAKAAMATAIK